MKSVSIEQSRKLSFHELCLFSLLVLWLSLLTAIPQHQFTAVLKKHAPARSETSCLRPPKLCFMPALNKLECTLRLLKRMKSCCYSDDFRFLNSVKSTVTFLFSWRNKISTVNSPVLIPQVHVDCGMLFSSFMAIIGLPQQLAEVNSSKIHPPYSLCLAPVTSVRILGIKFDCSFQ
jgi:hypothetical protein